MQGPTISPGETVISPSDEGEGEAEQLSPWQTRISALKGVFKAVVLPFLAVRACLILIGIVTISYIEPIIDHKVPFYEGVSYARFPAMLYLMWAHFDSGFYLTIASGGYWEANTLHTGSNWGFFPFYPLLIHLFGAPLHASWHGYMIIGFLVSNISALVAAWYLYKLTAKEFNLEIGARAAFLLGLFPMSFYLSAIYPESLFLAFVISAVYYARLRYWWLAGLLGACATLTRISGILLVVVLGWEYWQVLAEQYAPIEKTTGVWSFLRAWQHSRLIGLGRALMVWKNWGVGLGLVLIPAALGLFMLYSRWKIGVWKAYFIAQQFGWNHQMSNPLVVVWQLLEHPQPASPYNWNFSTLNILCTFFFLLMLIPIFRKLPALYGLLALAFLILPFTTGKMDSAARYDLTIFPVYMILAWWSCQGAINDQARRYALICVLFALLLALGMVLFTLNIYAIA